MGKKIRAIFRQIVFKTADAEPQVELYRRGEIAREMAKFPSYAAALEAGYDYEQDCEQERERERTRERERDQKRVGVEEGEVEVEVDADENEDLTKVLTFYDAEYLLPFAERVLWLSNVKEALGYIPFELSHDEIVALVILLSEVNKKSRQDLQKTSPTVPSAPLPPVSSTSNLPNPSLRRRNR